MRVWGAVMTALALASGTAEAGASEPVPVLDSSRFEAGRAPDSMLNPVARERPQAVNGALYAVVAPLYVGEGGFFSYLRLFNGGASTSTFSMSEVLVAANAVKRDPLDAQLSFYIQSPEPLAGYQHVTHSPQAAFFQNAAVCRWTLQDAVSARGVKRRAHQCPYLASGGARLSQRRRDSQIRRGARDVPHHSDRSDVRQYCWADDLRRARQRVILDSLGAVRKRNRLEPASDPDLRQSRGHGHVRGYSSRRARANLINDRLQVTLNATTMCSVNRPTSLGGDGGVIN